MTPQSNSLPLAIAGMADPINYLLTKSPASMTDAELSDLVSKARELGTSPQAFKAALGTPVGVAKKNNLKLVASATALLDD